MAENKEFESVDEIFRKTFDALQDTPSGSGWDTPSDRVWQQVQTGISQKNNGWNTGKLVTAAAIALVIAAGLYVTFKPDAPAVKTPAPAAPTETPAVATSPETVTAPATATEKTVLPAVKEKKKTTTFKPAAGSMVDTPQQPADQQGVSTDIPTEKADPQPASPQQKNAVKPPNSVERNKLKEKTREKQDTTQH